jgi:hypothetical protein
MDRVESNKYCKKNKNKLSILIIVQTMTLNGPQNEALIINKDKTNN